MRNFAMMLVLGVLLLNQSYAQTATVSEQVVQAPGQTSVKISPVAEDVFELAILGKWQELDSYISAGGKADVRDRDGNTVLMAAAANTRSLYVIDILVKKGGVDVNAVNKKGQTALMLAARDNKKLDVLRRLIENGADVKKIDKMKMNALMYAAWNQGNPVFVDVLVKAGTDVNAEDKRGNTALSFAAQYNKFPKVGKMLERLGAKLDVKNYKGKTAYDYALENKGYTETDTLALAPRTVW